MIDLNQEIPNENLTQKDIMQFLLHSTQHVATREELDGVKRELKEDISKVESSLKMDISKVEEKIDRVESSLKGDISKVEEKIEKVDAKFDKIQWLIVATIMTILLKDYILALV
ncbi:MAG: hypothetical protein U9N39_05610 [Campylobacterota bacterium]|nr:hypothetical protein [Campylobacterota bacterium]